MLKQPNAKTLYYQLGPGDVDIGPCDTGFRQGARTAAGQVDDIRIFIIIGIFCLVFNNLVCEIRIGRQRLKCLCVHKSLTIDR